MCHCMLHAVLWSLICILKRLLDRNRTSQYHRTFISLQYRDRTDRFSLAWVFGLIVCLALSPSLALPTFHDNNNNNNNNNYNNKYCGSYFIQIFLTNFFIRIQLKFLAITQVANSLRMIGILTLFFLVSLNILLLIINIILSTAYCREIKIVYINN